MAILVDVMAEVLHETLIDLKLTTTIDVIAPRREMLTAMREGRPEDAERAIRLHFEETGSLLVDDEPSAMAGWVRSKAAQLGERAGDRSVGYRKLGTAT